MSDDLSQQFLQDHEVDHELERDLAAIRSGRPLYPGLGQELGARAMAKQGTRIGRNALIAAYDSLRNVGELALDGMIAYHGKGIAGSGKQPNLSTLITGEATKEGGVGDVDLYDLAPDFMRAADRMRDEWVAGSTTADIVMQKALQFAVPFTGTMKALSGMAMAGKAGRVKQIIASDAIVSGSVWDPHEGRFADFLRTLAPDNRLVNAATEFLASNPVDTDAEGRFKNILDSQLAGATIGGFIFASARALRSARQQADQLIERLSKTAETK